MKENAESNVERETLVEPFLTLKWTDVPQKELRPSDTIN